MIDCGWCGRTTTPGRCASCHRDPALPWVQRGVKPPVADPHGEVRRRLHAAIGELDAQGEKATAERLAELLDVSPRTVRRWQQMTAE